MTKKTGIKKIIDGDTFEGTDGKFYRLEGVNTPEKQKRGYKKAKETLKELIQDEQVFVEGVGKSFGRIVAKVRKAGEKRTINEKMKRKGYSA